MAGHILQVADQSDPHGHQTREGSFSLPQPSHSLPTSGNRQTLLRVPEIFRLFFCHQDKMAHGWIWQEHAQPRKHWQQELSFLVVVNCLIGSPAFTLKKCWKLLMQLGKRRNHAILNSVKAQRYYFFFLLQCCGNSYRSSKLTAPWWRQNTALLKTKRAVSLEKSILLWQQ